MWVMIFVCLLMIPAVFLLAEGWSFLHYYSLLNTYAKICAPVVVLLSFGGSLLLQSFATGVIAELFCNKPQAFYPHIPAFIAYACALFALRAFCGAWLPVEALSVLFFWISGFFLGRARGTGKGKTESILYAAIPGLVLVALLVLFKALMAEGTEASFLTDFIRSGKECMQDLSRSTWSFFEKDLNRNGELFKYMVQAGVFPADATEETMNNYCMTAMEMGYTMFLYFLPALTTAGFCIAGYMSASILSGIRRLCGEKKKWKLTASAFGCCMFVFSAFFAGLLSSISLPGGNNSVLVLFFASMTVIYLPLMLAMGVQALGRLKVKTLMEHKIRTMLFIILFLMSPVYILAFFGATEALTARMMKIVKGTSPEDSESGNRPGGGDGNSKE